jgi:hypothetical protein
MQPVHFQASPEDASPLAQALGDSFKVRVGYRARMVDVICRRCQLSWRLPKREKDSRAAGSWILPHTFHCQGRRHRNPDARAPGSLDATHLL